MSAQDSQDNTQPLLPPFTPVVEQLQPAARQAVVKATVVAQGPSVPAPASKVPGDGMAATAFTAVGALLPPYEPDTLCVLYENSNSLSQNVAAYTTNIDAFGHRFTPVLDTTAEDADARIANAIILERTHAAERATGVEGTEVQPPTPEEIAARKMQVEKAARAELVRVQSFFDYCCPDRSFVSIRRALRQDIETLGNGYLEVLRNERGQVAQLHYVTGFTVRLMPADQQPTQVSAKVKVGELSFTEVPVYRRFRRYVQIWESITTYFKEFGDPRVVSSKSGRYFKTLAELKETEGESVLPASELLHFLVPSPRGPYGVPRWVGNMLSVLGSRQAEEINYLYFDNKSVPPLALLVSGGRLSAETVPRIENYIKEHIQGKQNFHSILIIEADDGGQMGGTALGTQNLNQTGRTRIELKPLMGAQQQDALFQKYDERNRDKVGEAFRLPRLLRGDVRDFNRATADAALKFAEQQVFAPEREEFDFIINRKLLTDMGVRYWSFVSNAPTTRDPDGLCQNITAMVNAGVVTPGEGREEAEAVFGRQFRHLNDQWTKQPLQLTLAQARAAATGMPDDGADAPAKPAAPGEAAKGGAPTPEQLAARARELIALRNHILKMEGDDAEGNFKIEHSADGLVTVLRIPQAQMDQLVIPAGK